jgi:hypothetical protein
MTKLSSKSKISAEKYMQYNLETGVTILPITSDRLAMLSVNREYQGKIFSLKSEFHITIIGSRLGQKLLAKLGNLEYQPRLSQMVNSIDWQWTLKPEFYHLAKEKIASLDNSIAGIGEKPLETIQAESIIQMVVIPGINVLYRQLSFWLEEQLIPPPTHVTLYVYGDLCGIGIADRADLNRYTIDSYTA